MRAAGPKKVRRTAPEAVAAILPERVTLEARANGEIFARFQGYSAGLGSFSAEAAARAQALRDGLPLASLASGNRGVDKEIDLLLRRLATRGLLGFRVGGDLAVVEPQTPDYWPQTPRLADADALVLSRFAYMRRRGDAIVLESPRADALFRLRDPMVASVLAALAAPRKVKELRRQPGFPGLTLLALLADCRILLKAGDDRRTAVAEGDESLALWEFHDLLFHARSTAGRHANPIGGVYPHLNAIAPLAALRPGWPGEEIDLRQVATEDVARVSPFAKLLRERHSARSFDARRPITLSELARFLDGAARVLWTSQAKGDVDDGGSAARPYPTAGAANELELYLAVEKCDGLARGFYHYDAGAHALAAIEAPRQAFETMLAAAAEAMGAPEAPQVLVVIAARFGRISWKYASIAYSLILKDAGVLTQTLYLMATEMGLGGCAIGISNVELFAKMTGIDFWVEGPVGQFALGRGAAS